MRACYAWTFAVTPNRVINYGNLRLFSSALRARSLMCFFSLNFYYFFAIIFFVASTESDGLKYHNEGSFFKMLSMDDKSILIGAR